MNCSPTIAIIQRGNRFYIQTETLSKYFEVLCFSLNVKLYRKLSLINHLEFATELKLRVLFAAIMLTWKFAVFEGEVLEAAPDIFWFATYL